jgi:hypothetical protein
MGEKEGWRRGEDEGWEGGAYGYAHYMRVGW